MNEALTPLFDWCLVTVLQTEGVTSGGIVMPAIRKRDTLKRVRVIAVGQGPYVISGEIVEPPVAEGQTLLISKGAGHKVYENNDDLLFIKAGDARAIVG